MKLSILALAAVPASFLLLAVPASAQQSHGGGSGSGGGGGAAHSGGGGGGTGGSGAGSHATSSGGGSPSGGSVSGSASRSSSGGSGAIPGDRHAATGGSGMAIARAGDRGASATGNGRRPESGGGANSTNTVSQGAGGAGAAGRRDGVAQLTRSVDGVMTGVPPGARPRNPNQPINGVAVPRGSVTPAPGSGVTFVTSGFYPWWLGGAGIGLSGLYSPYYYGGYYGGYSGAYYDPWFGGYPGGPGAYGVGAYGAGGYDDPQPSAPDSSHAADEGAVRLKIKPSNAEVYVDGYYVGLVSDFDGMFHKLHTESGSHRIEVRAPGYEPLTIDVRVTPDHATTYQGELKRIQ